MNRGKRGAISDLIALATSAVLVNGAANAATIDLFSYAINIDGGISTPKPLGDPIPSGVDISGFDESTGLGTISIEVAGSGTHYVGLFVDHEIDESTNTFFNEFGSSSGLLGPGQSWEIDEPGFLFGDINVNFANGALDDSNAVDLLNPDDVSMAQAFDFTLTSLEIATITFTVGEEAPSGGFFLTAQTDPDSEETLYFTASLDVQPIPEPAAAVVFAVGMLVVGAATRRRP